MSLLQFRRLLLTVCTAFISVLANAQSIDDFNQNVIWSNVTNKPRVVRALQLKNRALSRALERLELDENGRNSLE